MQRGKFTLVELLVVIAIISILAGMLLPALRAAVDQARLTSCQAQLKQMALATGMYEAEHGYYPPSLVDSLVGEPGGVTTWEDPKTALDLIFPYAPDRDLYFCPTSKSTFGYKGNYGHNRKVCVHGTALVAFRLGGFGTGSVCGRFSPLFLSGRCLCRLSLLVHFLGKFVRCLGDFFFGAIYRLQRISL